jgi:nucleoside-diphosphate-sugar epimerase
LKVLITGATGVAGRATTTELLRRGHSLRLLSRNAEQDVRAWEGDIEAFPADVGDSAQLRGAASDCDAIIHIAGIVEESPPHATFERINVGGTANVLAEASRAGVDRVVMVSSLGADRGESEYHRSKLAAERLVEQFAGSWTIVRPGSVFGPGDEAISLLLRMVRVLPAVPVIERGDQQFQPLWHGDLAWALAECLERDDLDGRVLDLAGPERTTVNDLIDAFAELTGREPRRLPLPGLLAQFGTELAAALGVEGVVKPATVTMLLEGNLIPDGRPNGLTDVLGRDTLPIRTRLAELAESLPEQTPDEGVGKLERRRFHAEIVGATRTADEIFQRFCARLDDFVAFDAEAEPGSDSRLEVGSTLTLELPPRGHAQVRVEEIGDGVITLGTVEGHPLAGVVRFTIEELRSGAIGFTIDIAERPATRVDQLAMAVVGRSAQREAWTETVERVIRASGGEAPDGVQHEAWELDGAAAEKLEDWVIERINSRRRAEHANGTDQQ